MSEIKDQPPPAANASRPIWELVVEDMQERDRVGRERYGTPLQAGNGRDALVDGYQEALDLAVYLRQAIEERDGGMAWNEPSQSEPRRWESGRIGQAVVMLALAALVALGIVAGILAIEAGLKWAGWLGR